MLIAVFEVGKDIMDAKKLGNYKEKLLQKRLSLTSMVQKTEGYGREKDQNIQDVADMAVESYTKEFLFGKSSGDRRILQLIQEALDRIDDKSYGECANCGNEIQPKRLEAVPWAVLCIQCQNLQEKGLLEP
ncbi:MAG: transcriptional regulator, TraR/DksA family [Acidobacteria bacterium]|jgi:DnaK suppressor protein|nr:transcriptional regulator, TraR/DksA family [Acidobacteriota bacterium]